MSESDTGETSRFKTKHIEPVTNVEDTNSSGDKWVSKYLSPSKKINSINEKFT